MTAPRARTSDRGSAGVEVAIAVVALMAMLFFIVGALRITTASGDVAAAARAAARAAAAERSTGSASAAARAIAATMLSSRGSHVTAVRRSRSRGACPPAVSCP
jgi:Flp pilus assembly protein TadG